MDPATNRNASQVAPSGASPACCNASRLELHTILYLILAVVAGAAFFGVYRTLIPVYEVPQHLLRMFPSDEDAAKRELAFDFAIVVHATVGLGILGLLTCGLMGIGEATARRPDRGALLRVVPGILVAVAIGALGGMLGAMLSNRLEWVPTFMDTEWGPMARTMLSQAIMLGLLGIGVGLGLGLIAGNGRMAASCAGAGLAAGILSAMLFPIVTGFAVPHVQTDVVLPDGSSGRFGLVGMRGTIGFAMWTGFAVVGLGLIIPLMNRSSGPAAKS